jgi:hypothetical protein
MALRFLADGKRSERPSRACAGVGDRERNRISAKGEATDGLNVPTMLVERMKPELADENQALGAHGCEPGVDV